MSVQAEHLAPPALAYSDPGALERERSSIFRTRWVVAGLSAEVAQPQSYLTTEVAGVPLVVTRDRDGHLNALANVCQHRGMILAQGSGAARALNCPNHAWSYALDGQLTSAPRSSIEAEFDCAAIHLPRYAVHEWGPLILVNLDPEAAPPLDSLDRIDGVLGEAGLDLATMRPAGAPLDWSIEANWKIVIENYLECYHCAWVHRDFSKVFDVAPQRYVSDAFGSLLASTAPVKVAHDVERQQHLLATDGRLVDSHWFLLFPTTTINMYPGQGAVEFTWYWPLDPHRTAARTALVVAPDATADYERQVAELLTQVGNEDNAVCEGMHRGMRSGALDRVRILPENEPLIARFHTMLADAVEYQEGVR